MGGIITDRQCFSQLSIKSTASALERCIFTAETLQIVKLNFPLRPNTRKKKNISENFGEGDERFKSERKRRRGGKGCDYGTVNVIVATEKQDFSRYEAHSIARETNQKPRFRDVDKFRHRKIRRLLR